MWEMDIGGFFRSVCCFLKYCNLPNGQEGMVCDGCTIFLAVIAR